MRRLNAQERRAILTILSWVQKLDAGDYGWCPASEAGYSETERAALLELERLLEELDQEGDRYAVS
jgi:RNA polymerase-binding transcription factor DksA